ncbi:hypothetical protein BH11BAC7_BH11BAC7_33400 [soil metagenome]
MVTLSILPMLSMILSINHQPVADQSVLVINEQADSILYSGKTDANGSFSWQYPQSMLNSKVFVLAKIGTSEIVSAESREIILHDSPQMQIDVITDQLQYCEFELKGDAGIPELYTVRLHPQSISGIPEKLTAFLSMLDNNVATFFYEHNFNKPVVHLKIKKGTYNINVDYITINSHNVIDTSSENYNATKAISKGLPLEGDKITGFKADIFSDMRIAFMMSVYPN